MASMNTHRACMTLSKEIVLGNDSEFELLGQPDTFFTPDTLVHNITSPMFVYIGNLSIAGQHLFIEGGYCDAFNSSLDFPQEFEMTPSMAIRMMVKYSGYIPAGCQFGQKVFVSFTFKGKGRWE